MLTSLCYRIDPNTLLTTYIPPSSVHFFGLIILVTSFLFRSSHFISIDLLNVVDAQSFHAFVVLHALYYDVEGGGDEGERGAAYDLDGVLRQLQPKLPLDKRMGATIALGSQGGSEGSSGDDGGGDGSESAGERTVPWVRCSLIPPAQTKLGQQGGAASPAPGGGKRGFNRRRTPPRPPPRRRVVLPLDNVAFIIAAEARGSGGDAASTAAARRTPTKRGAKGSATAAPLVPATSGAVLAAAMMEHVSVKMDTREPRAMHITLLSRARIEYAWCVVALAYSPFS